MRFDTKLAIVIRDDIPTWQKLNVTAFLVSGIASVTPESVGEPYEDKNGRRYHPMFRQPVTVFSADAAGLSTVFERLTSRDEICSIFIDELFSTTHDEVNRAAFKEAEPEDFSLAGLAFRTERRVADKITKGLKLHG